MAWCSVLVWPFTRWTAGYPDTSSTFAGSTWLLAAYSAIMGRSLKAFTIWAGCESGPPCWNMLKHFVIWTIVHTYGHMIYCMYIYTVCNSCPFKIFCCLSCQLHIRLKPRKSGWLSTLEASGVAKGGILWSLRPHSHRADGWEAAVIQRGEAERQCVLQKSAKVERWHQQGEKILWPSVTGNLLMLILHCWHYLIHPVQSCDLKQPQLRYVQ